jgi:adenosylhomocysteine nucleosidase
MNIDHDGVASVIRRVPLSALSGRDVLFVMAASAEYGPHLQARFQPLMTGVGPVEAGVLMGAALATLKAERRRPDLVVSLGSAGSRRLEQGAVYQASHISYRDMDASPLGFDRGVTPFLDLPAVVPLALSVPGIPTARLSTGGDIVSGAAYDAIDADMVDMESFAVLRACMLFGVPLIALRGISDGVADLTHVGDWTQYLHVVDERLAAAVDRLAIALEDGSIAV